MDGQTDRRTFAILESRLKSIMMIVDFGHGDGEASDVAGICSK